MAASTPFPSPNPSRVKGFSVPPPSLPPLKALAPAIFKAKSIPPASSPDCISETAACSSDRHPSFTSASHLRRAQQVSLSSASTAGTPQPSSGNKKTKSVSWAQVLTSNFPNYQSFNTPFFPPNHYIYDTQPNSSVLLHRIYHPPSSSWTLVSHKKSLNPLADLDLELVVDLSSDPLAAVVPVVLATITWPRIAEIQCAVWPAMLSVTEHTPSAARQSRTQIEALPNALRLPPWFTLDLLCWHLVLFIPLPDPLPHRSPLGRCMPLLVTIEGSLTRLRDVAPLITQDPHLLKGIFLLIYLQLENFKTPKELAPLLAMVIGPLIMLLLSPLGLIRVGSALPPHYPILHKSAAQTDNHMFIAPPPLVCVQRLLWYA